MREAKRPFFGMKLTNRQNTTGRWILTLSLAAGVATTAAIVGASAASRAGDEVRRPPRPLPVRTLPAEASPGYEVTRRYTGRTVARRTSALGFERGGKVIELLADDGDAVEAGAVLARLDVRALTARRAELRARHAGAQARLDEMEAGPRAETIAVARAGLAEAESQLALARLKDERRARLLADGVIGAEQRDEVATSLAALAAQRAGAAARLDELETGTRRERIAAQRAAVAELDAAIASIELDIEKSELRAPFAGTIAARSVDEGTVIAAGQPLLRLLERGAPEVRVGVPANVVAELGERDALPVEVGGRAHPARIRSLLPEVDPRTRTRTVVLHLDESAGVVPGEVARLPVTRTVREAGFWLPTTALVRGARGLWAVWVVVEDGDGPRVARRDVEVIHAETARAFVRGTLRDGDRVVRDGGQRVTVGQRVRIADEGDAVTARRS